SPDVHEHNGQLTVGIVSKESPLKRVHIGSSSTPQKVCLVAPTVPGIQTSVQLTSGESAPLTSDENCFSTSEDNSLQFTHDGASDPVTVFITTTTDTTRASNQDLTHLIRFNECKGCDLSGIDLDGADLSKVDLTGANLSSASFKEVNFLGANLANVNLNGTALGDTQWTDGYFCDADSIGSCGRTSVQVAFLITPTIELSPNAPLPSITGVCCITSSSEWQRFGLEGEFQDFECPSLLKPTSRLTTTPVRIDGTCNGSLYALYQNGVQGPFRNHLVEIHSDHQNYCTYGSTGDMTFCY
ncbi:MAG: pentapeptide repeat-containing protein, partial [Bdellovibrionales bacterium]|nr:pentapeptide repeat-containing protein [Bdellovibrionales bacterium]